MIRKILGDNIYHELILIKKNYYFSLDRFLRRKPIAIYLLDNRSFNHGFADRLRGMISVYAYAKANNIPFRIEHIVPFDLNTFFVPNQYDWNIKEGEISFNLLYSNPIVMRNYTRGYRMLRLSKNRQHHFYLNIDTIDIINTHYKTNYNYTSLFNELFKPSDFLLSQVKQYEKYIKDGYVSISFRFLQLMGDFEDIMGETLPVDEQYVLMNKCRNFIDTIYHKTNSKWILITSDSQKFINSLSSISYVFTIDGEIGHIGFSSSFETYIKTFMDFYMISQARKVFMGYTDKMYKSHFAESAAMTMGVQYESIRF